MYSWYSKLLWWRREATRMCVWHTRMVPATTMTGNTRMVRPLLFVIRNMELIPTGWSMEPVSEEPGINPLSSKFQNSIRIETASQAGLIASLTSLICGTEYINPATCLHAAFLSRLSCYCFVKRPSLTLSYMRLCDARMRGCEILLFHIQPSAEILIYSLSDKDIGRLEK